MIKISEREEEVFSETEYFIEQYFGVNVNKMVSRNTTNKVSIARNMMFYILHYDFKISIGKIAQAYFRTPRAVSLQISITKFQVKNEEAYKDMHDKIVQKIGKV